MFGLTKGALLAIGTATATVAVGALAYRAWQSVGVPPIVAATTTVPTTTGPTTTGPTTTGHAAAAPPVAAEATAHLQTEQAAPAAPQGAQPARPTFDVVRVEPTGDTVVAGRAAPDSEIALLDRGSVIAETKTDANGQFAIVPSPLPAGDHLLALGQKSSQGQIVSAQTVTIAVPQKKGAGDVVVALTEPDRPTRLLSDAAHPAPAADKPRAPPNNPEVAIRTVEMQQDGGFFATGSSAPGAKVKLYLNGSAVADVHAGSDGKWSLSISKGMQPGSYAVRADQVDVPSGKVVARAEVPFDYKAFAAPATIPGHEPAKDGSASDAVVAAIRTVTVVHGDSLWRISRKVLGRGIRYTQIYAANASQIRNPRLIYPGQVLVKPQTSVN